MKSFLNRVALRNALLIATILALTPLLAAAQDAAKTADGPKAAADAPAETATEVGATVCASCHTDKADAFKKSWHGRKMLEMKGLDPEKTCESCHGPGSLHVAAGGDATNPGFATVKISADATNDRCLACHKQRAVMNWKIGPHNQQGLACANCHKIHEAGVNPPIPSSEVCMGCHTKKRMEANLPFHHPIIEGKIQCYDCHNPHGGDFRNLVAESVNEVCGKCHAEKLGPFQQEHPPVAEDCTICHNPHGSVNEGLLKESMPNLCLNCHKFPHNGKVGGTGSSSEPGALLDHSRCINCHFAIHGDDDGGWFTNH